MTTYSKRVLVLFAHPALQRSRVNRRLAAAAQELPGVTFHDLYEAYPTMIVDVAREQALLQGHDVVVMQHPFYWYSSPALIKEWMDHVLTHGWAYGERGTALRDKALMVAITTGGPRAAYAAGGRNRFAIRALLAPQDQTAHLCGMHFLAPFVVHGAMALSPAQVDEAAAQYARVLRALRDDHLPLPAATSADYISEVLTHE